MSYTVLLTQDAETDIADIYNYIYDHDSPVKANRLIDKIEETIQKLTELPERGSYPLELIEHGITEYREIHFKPYRIVYKIQEQMVYVMLVVDGRRNLETLLFRRLFR